MQRRRGNDRPVPAEVSVTTHPPPSKQRSSNRSKSKWMGPIVMVLILFMAAIRLHTLVWSALESNDFHPHHGLFLNHPHHLRETKTTAARDVALQRDSSKDATDIARVWPFAPDNHPWCHLTSQTQSPPHGLVYIKIDKASSSTLAGINIRLAHKIGGRVAGDASICAHTYEHFHTWPRLSTGHDASQESTTLLWTFLRDPAERALSQYFHFLVSREGYGATYMLLHSFLESSKNFQLQYVMVPSAAAAAANANLNLTRLLHEVDDQTQQSSSLTFLDSFVMQRYNFMGLVERMDESLAVMKLLWNLEVGDLIVLSAKQAGGYDDGRYQNKCVKIMKPGDFFRRDPKGQRLYDRIQDYLEVDYRHNNLDYQLYQAINVSLDRTIARLGRDLVDQTVRVIQSMREEVNAKCQNDVVFPCSFNGTNQLELSAKNCYWYDSGCGFPCVDRVVDGIVT